MYSYNSLRSHHHLDPKKSFLHVLVDMERKPQN